MAGGSRDSNLATQVHMYLGREIGKVNTVNARENESNKMNLQNTRADEHSRCSRGRGYIFYILVRGWVFSVRDEHSGM